MNGADSWRVTTWKTKNRIRIRPWRPRVPSGNPDPACVTSVRPTVGRNILCRDRADLGDQAIPGLVIEAFDAGPGTVPTIDVAVFGNRPGTGTCPHANWYGVPVYDPGAVPAGVTRWCEWMPYQVLKAAG